jgi:hypothetical protein
MRSVLASGLQSPTLKARPAPDDGVAAEDAFIFACVSKMKTWQ